MSEGDQFDRAIKCLFDNNPQSTPFKQKAQNYLDGFKKKKDFWQLLFQKTLNPQTDECVSFWCFQALADLLNAGFYQKALSPPDKEKFRNGLLQWMSRVLVVKNLGSFVKNKYTQVLVKLFAQEYLRSWGSFFREIFRFVGQSSRRPQNEFMVIVDMFLRILESIHEDLFALRAKNKYISEAQIKALKERMRVDCVGGLATLWKRILNLRNPNMSRSCLNVMSKYIDWIDIKLMTHPDFVKLYHQLVNIPETRKESMLVFAAMVNKGMPSHAKIQMIEHLKLVDLLKSLSRSPFKEEDVYLNYAALCNSVGTQILEAWAKMNNKTVPRRLLNDMLETILMKLCAEKNFRVVLGIQEFFRNYIHTLITKQRVTGSTSPQEVKRVKFMLNIIRNGTVYPNNFNFDLAVQQEREAMFVMYRRSWFQIYENIVKLMGKDVVSFISPLMEQTLTNLRNISFPKLEIALRLFYSCLEKYKPPPQSGGKRNPQQQKKPPQTDPNEKFFTYVICEIIKRQVIRFPHGEIKKLYFDLVTKYAHSLVKLQDRQKRANLVKEVLDAFLSHGFVSKNYQVQTRCYHQFLKFVQSTNLLLLPHMEDLSRRILPCMKLVPEPPKQADEYGRHEGVNVNQGRPIDYKKDLFEAMGVLLSLKPLTRRVYHMQKFMGPLLQQIREIMAKKLVQTRDRPDQPIFSVLVGKDITALSNLIKNFPKNGEIGKEILNICHDKVFSVIMNVFRTLPHNPLLHGHVCSFMNSLMPIFPHRQLVKIFTPPLKEIFQASNSAMELNGVFGIVKLMLNMEKENAYPMVNSLLIPLTKKILEITNDSKYLQRPKQFEMHSELYSCQRQYLDFLHSVCQRKKGCYRAYFSNENGKHFIKICEVALKAVDALGDPFYRIIQDGFKVLDQLIKMAFAMQKKSSGRVNPMLFNFVLTKLIPIYLQYPLKTFVDTESADVVQNVFKAIDICRLVAGENRAQFVQFMKSFLRKSRFQMSENEVSLFLRGMLEGDRKDSMSMLQSLYKNKKKF